MKLNRKWILVIALLMSVAMATAGTLAYLTDRDSERNVFEIGNVEIDLNEEFDPDNAVLIPGVDIEKKPTITNTGKNDAWVWATIAIPAGLDNDDASKNVVHFNYTKESVADGLWNWQDENGNWNIQKDVEIEGEKYNVYTVLYETALKPGETTSEPVMTKVYMDPHVDIDPEGNMAHVENGVVTDLGWNVNENGQPVIFVSAYAMQTNGFDTVQEAYAAYNTQWGNNGTEWGKDDGEIDSEIPVKNGDDETVTYDIPANAYKVTSSEELTAAVANGYTVIELADGEYDVTGCGGKELSLYGSKKAVLKLTNEGEDGCDYGFGSSGTGVGKVTFYGLTIDTTANTGNYKGYAYMGATFNDCTFVGAYSLNNANTFEFNYCDFDFKNGYFWTWGAKSATFNNCTFNGNSKCILAHGWESTQITINNCKFAATEKGYTGAGDNTACVEIDPAGTNTYTINFTGSNTKTDSYSGWTRVKDGSTGNVISGLE